MPRPLTDTEKEQLLESHLEKFWDAMTGVRAKASIICQEYDIPPGKFQDEFNRLMTALEEIVGANYEPEPREE